MAAGTAHGGRGGGATRLAPAITNSKSLCFALHISWDAVSNHVLACAALRHCGHARALLAQLRARSMVGEGRSASQNLPAPIAMSGKVLNDSEHGKSLHVKTQHVPSTSRSNRATVCTCARSALAFSCRLSITCFLEDARHYSLASAALRVY